MNYLRPRGSEAHIVVPGSVAPGNGGDRDWAEFVPRNDGTLVLGLCVYDSQRRYQTMAYRDDRHALPLQVVELERENQRLREEIASLHDDAQRGRDQARESQRRSSNERGCVMCGGSLLPVAVFAGNDLRAPIPLALSTLRFGDPEGGFTRSAPIKAKVCASCGYVHCFIDIGHGLGGAAVAPATEGEESSSEVDP